MLLHCQVIVGLGAEGRAQHAYLEKEQHPGATIAVEPG